MAVQAACRQQYMRMMLQTAQGEVDDTRAGMGGEDGVGACQGRDVVGGVAAHTGAMEEACDKQKDGQRSYFLMQ